MASATDDPSPSAARRKALREADASNAIYNVIESYPIESYFAMTERLLKEFEAAVDQRRLDNAYVFGVRFATFSIDALPKHKQYSKCKKLRLINSRQVDQVLVSLQNITARMDAEELARQRQEQQAAREQEVQKEQARQEAIEREARERKEALEQEAKRREERQANVEKTALAKLKLLGQSLSSREAGSVTKPSSLPKKLDSPTAAAAASTKPAPLPSTKQPQPNAAKKLVKRKHIPRSAAPELLQESVAIATIGKNATTVDNDMPEGLSAGERRAIRQLQEAMHKQEARIPILERTMDNLRSEAKALLHDGHRRAALARMAQRKRLSKSCKAAKGSVFVMETQILRIESAATDREVQTAMQSAAQAMQAVQGPSIAEWTAELGEGVMESNAIQSALAAGALDGLDEDELLKEILSDEEESVVADDHHAEFLSLPTLPNNVPVLPSSPQKEDSSESPEPVMATLM